MTIRNALKEKDLKPPRSIIEARSILCRDTNNATGVKPLKSILKKPRVSAVGISHNGGVSAEGADVHVTMDNKKVSIDMSPPSVHVDGIKQKGADNGVGTNTNGVAYGVGTGGYPPVVDTPIVSSVAFPANKHATPTSGLQHVDRVIQSGIDDMHVVVVQHGDKSGVDANNSPKSFANMLKPERNTKKINFCSLSNEENVVNSDVVLPKHAKEEVMSRYENTLIGYFVGKSIAFPLVQNYVNNTWSKFGLRKVMRTNNGKCEVTKVPVWVKLHNVHVLAYSDVGLSLIATKIGKPIMLDAFTSLTCVESWGRIGFARALIEVSAESILKNEVIMAIPDEEGDGHSREVIRVEEAALKDPTRASKSTSVEENEDGFVQVKSRKKNNTGQESGINLSKCNPNFQYRLVSQPKKERVKLLKKLLAIRKSTWNQDLESDDKVDEVIFPEGNKWDDQFDIRLKGRVRK
nr:hypothetical protein [Tanacetum cinerariifolium]GEY27526.1 hypothetical protein [Tanacetum cinerariifolium]